jgi:tetratricopeptide (TPR) repeat protein
VLDAGEEPAPATRVFTPGYAAPEQLRGERVTTATDIYALGLLLYELVSGRHLPARESKEEWTTAELARHATSLEAESVPVLADPKNVTRLLRGDLGRIIAHALAPEPARRYASVALLRDDLERWLEFRPLSIARPTFHSTTAQCARRHRAAVAVGAVALAALIGMSIVALLQARDARIMAGRADHARSFLADLFASADPFAVKTGGRNAADLLRGGAERIDREFGDAPEMQAELRTTIAAALDRIGEPTQARDLISRSVEQLRAIHGTNAPQVGATLAALALAREDSGDLDGAHRDFSDAYAILQGTGAAYAKARIDAVTGLAKLANLRGDYADAGRMHEAVLRERTASEGPDSPDIAMDLMNLAADALYAERYAQAETLAQSAHAMLERTLGPHHARSIYVDNVLGLAQGSAGRTDAGIATLRAALELARATLQPGAGMIGNVLSSLGSVQLLAGDDAAAILTLGEARTLNDAAKNPRRAMTAMLLGVAQLRSGNAEALTTLHEAGAAMAAQSSSNDPAFVAWGEAAYAAALAAHGDVVEGERRARAARASLLASPRANSVRLGEVDLLLGDVLERNSHFDEARQRREEALATFQRVYGAEHPRTRAAQSMLAAMR